MPLLRAFRGLKFNWRRLNRFFHKSIFAAVFSVIAGLSVPINSGRIEWHSLLTKMAITQFCHLWCNLLSATSCWYARQVSNIYLREVQHKSSRARIHLLSLLTGAIKLDICSAIGASSPLVWLAGLTTKRISLWY